MHAPSVYTNMDLIFPRQIDIIQLSLKLVMVLKAVVSVDIRAVQSGFISPQPPQPHLRELGAVCYIDLNQNLPLWALH